MDNRTLGIIGGVALFIALISPFFMENSEKVEKLYKEAETFRQNNKYMNAVDKYTAALKESKKFGKTSIDIDPNFPTLPIHILTKYKIALCYYEHGKALNDFVQYSKARTYIDEIIDITSDNKLRWNLKYLQAMILYRKGKFDIAKVKLIELEKSLRTDAQWIPEVVFAIGDIYFQQAENLSDEAKQKMCDEAKNYFQKVIDNFPNSDYFIQADNRINQIKEISRKKDKPDPQPLPPSEMEVKQILDQADSFRKKQEFIRAMELYKKLIELYPESRFKTLAYEGKGDIYNEESNYIQALANYEEAIYSTEDHERRRMLYDKYQSVFPIPKPIPPDPDPVIKKYNEAIQLQEQNKYLEAAKILEEILKDTENSYYIRLYFRRACDCYYRAYLAEILQYQDSIDRLRELGAEYKDGPFSIVAFQHIIQIYQKESKLYFVKQTIESILSHYTHVADKTIVDVLDSWRTYLVNNGDEENTRIPPPHIDPKEVILYEEAERLFKRNRLEEAYKKLEESIRHDPDYKPALDLKKSILKKYLEEGINYYENKNYQKAIDQFQQILNYNQKFAKAHCNLGITYIRMNRFEDAIDSLKKAVHHNQIFKEAYFYLGFAYYKLGKYSEATDGVDKALSIDRNYNEAKMLKLAIENNPIQSQ